MVLKIEQTSDGSRQKFVLSGRIESSSVPQLKAQIDGNEKEVVLDLAQVRIVDRDAVRFLADCERKGIELRDCPPFVRAWIVSEKPRAGELE
jgi:anti-anti-sigma regulatory factor